MKDFNDFKNIKKLHEGHKGIVIFSTSQYYGIIRKLIKNIGFIVIRYLLIILKEPFYQ